MVHSSMYSTRPTSLRRLTKILPDWLFVRNLIRRECLSLSLDFGEFIKELQKTLVASKIGILHIENFDPEDGSIVHTVR